MAAATHYSKIEAFNSFFQRLKLDKTDFKLTQTHYTKTLQYENQRIVFNEEGTGEPALLNLIQNVRRDASAYDLVSEVKDVQDDLIWCDLTAAPPDAIACKVDINGAYWESALRLGVVSEETNRLLIKLYPRKRFYLSLIFRQAQDDE